MRQSTDPHPCDDGDIRALAIDEGTRTRAPRAGTPPTAEPPAYLDPRRWTDRHTRFVAAGAAVVLVAWIVEAFQTYPASGLRAAFGAAVAVAIVGFVLTLRGITRSGLLVGGFVVFAGIMSWTWTDTPAVPWAVFAVEGVVLAVWTFPWFRDGLRVPRLGTAWLGIAYWPLGIISAVLTASWAIGAQRVAFFGLAALTGIAAVVAVRRSGRDPSVGVVAAFLLAIALLFLAGSGNVFDDVHATPGNAWGSRMQFRFWGGPGFLYHPNSLAAIAVVAGLRIALDRAFRSWQRGAALGVLGLVIVLTNSRTAILFAFVGAVVHAALLLRQHLRLRRGRTPAADDLPVYGSGRRIIAAALVPFVLLTIVFIGSGGTRFLVQSRYQNTTSTEEPEDAGESSGGELDITSGRRETWKKVFSDFGEDPVAAKLFGNNEHARGAVIRVETGRPEDRPKLSTDNAVVGALRRAGILGLLAFALGLVLMLYHAVRRGAPAWFTIVAVASLSTLATSDWLLGGSGGTLWIFLIVGEAWIVLSGSRDRSRDPEPEPSRPGSAPEPA